MAAILSRPQCIKVRTPSSPVVSSCQDSASKSQHIIPISQSHQSTGDTTISNMLGCWPLKDKLMTCTNICRCSHNSCSHNSDIIASEITGIPTLILQWHYMSIIASQITGISIVCSKFILFQKRNTEVWSPILLSLCEEKPPVFSLTKEQSFRNHFHAILSPRTPHNIAHWQVAPPARPPSRWISGEPLIWF